MKMISKMRGFFSVINGFLLSLLGIQNNLALVPVPIKRTRFNQ
ncbi:hypothetical protein [uncultured Mucilaginibacter sp.]|nr:hypothetical protein [uncultured Mucilaginibacter sp.]